MVGPITTCKNTQLCSPRMWGNEWERAAQPFPELWQVYTVGMTTKWQTLAE